MHKTIFIFLFSILIMGFAFSEEKKECVWAYSGEICCGKPVVETLTNWSIVTVVQIIEQGWDKTSVLTSDGRWYPKEYIYPLKESCREIKRDDSVTETIHKYSSQRVEGIIYKGYNCYYYLSDNQWYDEDDVEKNLCKECKESEEKIYHYGEDENSKCIKNWVTENVLEEKYRKEIINDWLKRNNINVSYTIFIGSKEFKKERAILINELTIACEENDKDPTQPFDEDENSICIEKWLQEKKEIEQERLKIIKDWMKLNNVVEEHTTNLIYGKKYKENRNKFIKDLKLVCEESHPLIK